MTDFHPCHPARRHLHQSAGRHAGDSRASSASHLLSSINHRPSTLGPTISHQLPTLNYPQFTALTRSPQPATLASCRRVNLHHGAPGEPPPACPPPTPLCL